MLIFCGSAYISLVITLCALIFLPFIYNIQRNFVRIGTDWISQKLIFLISRVIKIASIFFYYIHFLIDRIFNDR